MAKMGKENTDRVETRKRKCVRFNDKKDKNDENGLDTKFYKTFQKKWMGVRYRFCVKWVEERARGCSRPSVAERKGFHGFRRVSKALKLEAMPKGYHESKPKDKRETVKQLVDEHLRELAEAIGHGPVQGVDTEADDSDDMQVSEGSVPQFNVIVGEDVDTQVNNPVQIQVDEVRAAAPNPDLGKTVCKEASSQNVAGNQWDNRGGQSRSLLLAQLQLLVSNFTNLMQSARVLPDMWPQIEETLTSFVSQGREACGGDRSDPLQEGFHLKVEYSSVPQNETSMLSVEPWEAADGFLNNSPEACDPSPPSHAGGLEWTILDQYGE